MKLLLQGRRCFWRGIRWSGVEGSKAKDISAAGLQAGLSGERSSLITHIWRVADELQNTLQLVNIYISVRAKFQARPDKQLYKYSGHAKHPSPRQTPIPGSSFGWRMSPHCCLRTCMISCSTSWRITGAHSSGMMLLRGLGEDSVCVACTLAQELHRRVQDNLVVFDRALGRRSGRRLKTWSSSILDRRYGGGASSFWHASQTSNGLRPGQRAFQWHCLATTVCSLGPCYI